MAEEVKAKSRLSNNVLWGILAALVLLIVGLIIGIIIANINNAKKLTNTLGENGEQVSETYAAAQSSCGSMRAAQASMDDDAYKTAVETFENDSQADDVKNNPDFAYCYSLMTDYYRRVEGNDEKADYNAEIYNSMVPQEDLEEQERLIETMKAERQVELEEIEQELGE